jgi:6-pyruvoyltetrahydropterin/6-carboxytetrahydropterin synthase
MYKITIETHFSSAHQLVGYNGDCERIHGHNWIIKVQVIPQKLDKVGIGFDFKKLKLMVNEFISKFDHQMLNTIPPFDEINPTSENIARVIFDELKVKLPEDIRVYSVEVKESEKCSVVYTED